MTKHGYSAATTRDDPPNWGGGCTECKTPGAMRVHMTWPKQNELHAEMQRQQWPLWENRRIGLAYTLSSFLEWLPKWPRVTKHGTKQIPHVWVTYFYLTWGFPISRLDQSKLPSSKIWTWNISKHCWKWSLGRTRSISRYLSFPKGTHRFFINRPAGKKTYEKSCQSFPLHPLTPATSAPRQLPSRARKLASLLWNRLLLRVWVQPTDPKGTCRSLNLTNYLISNVWLGPNLKRIHSLRFESLKSPEMVHLWIHSRGLQAPHNNFRAHARRQCRKCSHTFARDEASRYPGLMHSLWPWRPW